jgi:hypothetical protein
VREQFYWALLWNTYAVRNPVPTALQTQRQTDKYCLWDRQFKEADEQTLWQRWELCITKLTVFWHTFISHVLVHIYLSCFGTYLYLMFWHVPISRVLAHIGYVYISHILAHVYLTCFGTYLSLFWYIFISHVLAHIYLRFGTYISLMFWHIFILGPPFIT